MLGVTADKMSQLCQITFHLSHEHSRSVSYLRSSKNPLGVDNWSYVIDSRTFTKEAPSKCCYKRRPREAHIFHVFFLGLRLNQNYQFQHFVPYLQLLMIRWLPKDITHQQALENTIFNICKELDAVIFLVKYYAVSTCELLARV